MIKNMKIKIKYVNDECLNVKEFLIMLMVGITMFL